MTTVTKEARNRRERKKAAIRAQIIATAVGLFSRQGIADVTVEEIAEAADIGKGTVYNYFVTKEDIVVAFMMELEQRVQAKVSRFAASASSLDSILAGLIRFQFRLKEPYHAFVRVFLAQMFARTEQFLPYMVEMQKTIDPPLQALFQGLQQRERLRKDLDIAPLIVTFKTIHLGLTALWAIEGPPFRQTEITLRHEMKLFCEGLRTKK